VGGGWKSLDNHRDVIASLWIRKQSNPKQINISDNQQLSEGKQWRDLAMILGVP
jgi:hypothetical protein